MKRITGIGGIFFKAERPDLLRDWYARHLGLPMQEHGSELKWREYDNPKREAYTLWSPFPRDTKYFGKKTTDFMINFRVVDLDSLLGVLRKEGVAVENRVGKHEYGRFAWIHDPEGNRVELWEPPRPRESYRRRDSAKRARTSPASSRNRSK